jgi:hypothetical protein
MSDVVASAVPGLVVWAAPLWLKLPILAACLLAAWGLAAAIRRWAFREKDER